MPTTVCIRHVHFTVYGVKISLFPRFIIALAMVKKACMAANLEFGYSPQKKHRLSVKPAMKSLTASYTSISWSIWFREVLGTSTKYECQ